MPPKKILGLITARGGSKRVPRKNINVFCGKPLIAWSIETGNAAGVFDRFILSTEDDEIAAVGKQYGIEVLFKRPEDFATDSAGSYGVVKHAVEWLKEHGNFQPDWIILLEPSSPGRQTFHIKEVADIINQKGDELDSIIGISPSPGQFSPHRAFELNNGLLERVGDRVTLRQVLKTAKKDISTTYFINSAIYAFNVKTLFDGNESLWGDKTHGYVMDEQYALDIDTMGDWIAAEAKMKYLLGQ